MARVKVRQDMIDFIKAQGMNASLKRAGQIQAKGLKGEAEFVEGVRRMYGQNRLDKATGTYAKPRFKSADAAKASMVKKTTSTKPKKK